MISLDSRDERTDGFCKFYISETINYIHFVSERKILPRDFAIFFVMLSYFDTKTGKIRFSSKTLASQVNMNAATVSASIKRLKSAYMIASFVEFNGDKYYLANPHLVSIGGKQKLGHLFTQFASAFE